MNAQEVPVEIRLWATEPSNHLVRIPVGERGVLVADHPDSQGTGPVLLMDGTPYAPWTEEAFAAVLLVLEEPTREQTKLLHAAAEAGYCIEPRVVSRPWRDIEPLVEGAGTFWVVEPGE